MQPALEHRTLRRPAEHTAAAACNGSKRQRGRIPGLSFLLLALTSALLLLLSAPQVLAQDATTSSGNKFERRDIDFSSYTPQEAYDRALHLLRSTTTSYQQAKAAGRASGSSSSGSSKSRSRQQGGDAKPTTALGRAWRALQASSTYHPFGALFRLWAQFSDFCHQTIQAAKYSQLFVARVINYLRSLTGGGAAAVTPAAWHARAAGGAAAAGGTYAYGSSSSKGKASRFSTEQFYVTTGVDSDSAAHDAAARWEGARARPLWPNWEVHSNEALFGPFIDGAAGTRKQKQSYTDRIFFAARDAVLGRRKGSAQDRGTEAGLSRRARKVDEAVRLLEWAAYSNDAAIDAGPSAAQVIAAALAAPNNGTASTHQPDVRSDALWVLGEHWLWGTHGTESDVPRAKQAFQQLALSTGNSSAHARLGFLASSRWSGSALSELDGPADTPHQQAEALLHFEAAAYGGNSDGQIALAYRYHAGIGTPESCADAMKWYESAADQGELALQRKRFRRQMLRQTSLPSVRALQ